MPLFEIEIAARGLIALDHQFFADEWRGAKEGYQLRTGPHRFNGRHGCQGLTHPFSVLASRSKSTADGLDQSRIARSHGDLDAS